VKVRCNHAAERSVPFPEAWHTALKSLGVPSIAENSAQGARERYNVVARRDSTVRAAVVLEPAMPPKHAFTAACLDGIGARAVDAVRKSNAEAAALAHLSCEYPPRITIHHNKKMSHVLYYEGTAACPTMTAALTRRSR